MSRFYKPDRIGPVTVLFLLLLLLIIGQSDAFNYRKLAEISDQDSPSSSPPPPGKTPDLPPVGAPKPKDKTVANASHVESNSLNDANTENGSESSSDKKLEPGKSQDGKGLETFASENCKTNSVCNDQGKTIMACAQDFENGSNNLTLIVKNEQDVDLKVNIKIGNGYLQTFVLPSHATDKVNITISGDKSNKVILNAGNGDCELKISQPSSVNSPSKPKDPENTPNVKDVDNAKDSPTKPKDATNSTDSPIKPNDVNTTADSQTKPKDEKDPAKSNTDAPPKSTEVNAPPKSKEVNPPPKSQDVDDGSKSEEADDSTKSNSKDVDDGSKPTTNVNTPVSKNNFLDQLTFYSKQITPIHGAYAAFLVALVIGGLWALCCFRKRRTDGGVRYQELEMGPTEPSNTVDVEIAEGWEQDWDDDDWDEDKAITSPGGSNHVKTISSNGLTSRATKKDSWDADWDD